MKMNRILSVAVCVATLLFAGVEASAQRGTSTRSSSSSTTTVTSSGRSSASDRNATTRDHSNVAPRNTKSSTTSSTSKPAAPEAKPTLESRGSVQTGTNNKRLKPEHVSPSENYKKLPSRGTTVTKYKATKNAHYVKHGTVDYYFKKGVFYSYDPIHKHYVVSRPPVGLRVPTIPQSRIIYLHDVNYYYYYGVFYRRVASVYEVVLPPVGAIVESIPDGYEQLMINGNTYYIVDGVQYKAVVYHGEIWYEVIKLLD